MSKQKRIILVLLFILSGALIQSAYSEGRYVAKNGVIDLREHNFDSSGTLSLRGSWNFAGDKFVPPEEANSYKNYDSIIVPKNWKGQIINNKIQESVGYGTYYLKILINKEEIGRIFRLKTLTIPTASVSYINGKQVGFGGVIASSKEKITPDYEVTFTSFVAVSDTLNLVIHVSNFHRLKGGIFYDLYFGTDQQINTDINEGLAADYFIVGCLTLMMIYHLGLFFLRRRDKSTLYLALICFSFILYILFLHHVYQLIFPQLGFEFDHSIKRIGLYASMPSMALFVYSLYRKVFSRAVFLIIVILNALFILGTIFLRSEINSYFITFFSYCALPSGFYLIFVLIRALIKKQEGAGLLLVGACILFISSINDFLYNQEVIQTADLMPVGITLFIYTQAFVLSVRSRNAHRKTEKLSEDLIYINKNLEKLVDERTAEIQNQKHEIEEKNEELKQLVEEVVTQRDEIESQRDLMEEQRDKIEIIHNEIKESIAYAEKIQFSILSDIGQVKALISDCFVLFKPRDVVSGDFYWFAHVEGQLIATAADCTGHGVPGAFMSMLGISFLREIIVKEYITHSGVILRKLRKEIIKTLKQKGEIGEQKDGMDMSLVSINLDTKRMQFSGANNPLFILRNAEAPAIENVEPINFDSVNLYEIKGDKMPIAIYERMDKFGTTEIDLLDNDVLYMFSDGFPDQFGGPKGKKFMYKPFKKLLAESSQLPMKEQEELLDKKFSEWISHIDPYSGISFEQVDDVVVVALKI